MTSLYLLLISLFPGQVLLEIAKFKTWVSSTKFMIRILLQPYFDIGFDTRMEHCNIS